MRKKEFWLGNINKYCESYECFFLSGLKCVYKTESSDSDKEQAFVQ